MTKCKNCGHEIVFCIDRYWHTGKNYKSDLDITEKCNHLTKTKELCNCDKPKKETDQRCP